MQHFYKQKKPSRWLIKSDSDYAGCLVSRNSTSSNYLFHGSHLIRSSATTQKLPGLSVGETEFMSLVKAASVGLGAVAMGTDLGTTLRLDLETDSTTAKAISLRRVLARFDTCTHRCCGCRSVRSRRTSMFLELMESLLQQTWGPSLLMLLQ